MELIVEQNDQRIIAVSGNDLYPVGELFFATVTSLLILVSQSHTRNWAKEYAFNSLQSLAIGRTALTTGARYRIVGTDLSGLAGALKTRYVIDEVPPRPDPLLSGILSKVLRDLRDLSDDKVNDQYMPVYMIQLERMLHIDNDKLALVARASTRWPTLTNTVQEEFLADLIEEIGVRSTMLDTLTKLTNLEEEVIA